MKVCLLPIFIFLQLIQKIKLFQEYVQYLDSASVSYPHIINGGLIVFSNINGKGFIFNENTELIRETSLIEIDKSSTVITINEDKGIYVIAKRENNAKLILYQDSLEIDYKLFSNSYVYQYFLIDLLENPNKIIFSYVSGSTLNIYLLEINSNSFQEIKNISFQVQGNYVDFYELSKEKLICFYYDSLLEYIIITPTNLIYSQRVSVGSIGGLGYLKIMPTNNKQLIVGFQSNNLSYALINISDLSNITCQVYETSLPVNGYTYIDFMYYNSTTFFSAIVDITRTKIDFGVQNYIKHFTKKYSLPISNVYHFKFTLFGTKPAIFFSTNNNYYQLLVEPPCLNNQVTSVFMNSPNEINFSPLVTRGIFDDSQSLIRFIFPRLPSKGRLYLKSSNTTIQSDVPYDDIIMYEAEMEITSFLFTFAGVIDSGAGQYCNHTLKVVKCHDTCFSCTNDTEKGCLKCADGYYPMEGTIAPCLSQIPDGFYIDQTDKVIKKCYGTCQTCKKGGNNIQHNCDECVSNLYQKENKDGNCLQNPDGYYLDNVDLVYKKCYSSCKLCYGEGSQNNHNCQSCVGNLTHNSITNNCECPSDQCLINGKCEHFENKYVKQGNVCINCKNIMSYLIYGETTCTPNKPTIRYELIDDAYNLYQKCNSLWFTDDNGENHCISESNCLSTSDRNIFEKIYNQCVKNCLPYYQISFCFSCTQSSLYEYKGECIAQCPKDFVSNDTSHQCLKYDPITDLKECKDSSCIQKATSSMKDIVKEYVNNTIIINGENYTMEIYSTNDPYTGNPNSSTIELGECENLLRAHYHIPEGENLIITKMDLYYSNKATVQVEYKIFDSKGNELDLSICQDVPINISAPINPNADINIDQAKEMAELGFDIFDAESDFFNDVCVPYSKSGNDVTLSDRRTVIFQNVTFCDEGCTYKGINFEINKVDCECQIKTSMKIIRNETSNSTKEFVSSLFNVNIDIMKCVKLLTYWENIYTNIGLILNCGIMIAQISCVVVCGVREIILWRAKIHNLFTSSPPRTNKSVSELALTQEENGYNKDEDASSSKSVNVKIYITKEKDIELYTSNSKVLSKETNEETGQIDLSEKNTFDDPKIKFAYLHQNQEQLFFIQKMDIDSYPYPLAKEKDQRNLCQMFLKLFQEKQLFLRAFFFRSKFELLSVNLSLFFSDLAMLFVLNGLFYTNNQISSRYKGELNYIQNILRSIYSWLVGRVVFAILTCSFSFTPALDTIVYEIKEKNDLMRLMNKATKIIQRNLIIFFIVEFLFSLLFFYYVSLFCIVYHSTQIDWLIGGITSFGISLVLCFATCFFLAILRITGLKCNSVLVFNLSVFLNSWL